MVLLQYPAELRFDDGEWIVTFPDVGYGVTNGDTREEALENAEDLLVEAIEGMIANGEPIPRPSAPGGRPMVRVPPLTALKAAVFMALQDSGVTQAEAARRLGWHQPQVQRVLDPGHRSRLDKADDWMQALGRKLVIGFEEGGEHGQGA